MNPGIATKALSVVEQSFHHEKVSNCFCTYFPFLQKWSYYEPSDAAKVKDYSSYKTIDLQAHTIPEFNFAKITSCQSIRQNPKVEIIAFKIKASFFPHCFSLLNTTIQTLTQEVPNTLIMGMCVVEGFPKHLSRLLSPLLSCATQ